jgi:hypothetical protein
MREGRPRRGRPSPLQDRYGHPRSRPRPLVRLGVMPRRPASGLMISLFASVVVATALTLAGCGTPILGQATSPPTTAPPAAEPVDAVPTPRVDATCDDLLSTPALQEFVGEGTRPLELVDESARSTPDGLALRQLGSLECVWTTAPGPLPLYNDAPNSERRVILTVLPEGPEAAQRYVDEYSVVSGPSDYGPGIPGTGLPGSRPAGGRRHGCLRPPGLGRRGVGPTFF